MLLSPDELAFFRRLVEADDPRIYADEYNLGEFALPTDQMASAVPRTSKGYSGEEGEPPLSRLSALGKRSSHHRKPERRSPLPT